MGVQMLKLCSLLPIEHMHFNEGLNDYELILSHLCNESDRYTRFYKLYNGYKILDNSGFELQQSCSNDILYKAAIECNVQEYFIPEIFNDESKSVIKRQEFLETETYTKLHDKITIQAIQSINFDNSKIVANRVSVPAHLDRIKVMKKLNNTYRFNAYFSGLTGGNRYFDIKKIAELITLLKLYPNMDIMIDTSIPFLMTKAGTSIADAIKYEEKVKFEKMDFYEIEPINLQLYLKNVFNFKSLNTFNKSIAEIRNLN